MTKRLGMPHQERGKENEHEQVYKIDRISYVAVGVD